MKRVPHRYPLLSRIESPADLRRLPTAMLPALADELRGFLVQAVSHQEDPTAAAFGTVELAIAVQYVFDTPEDRIVWDGGQQPYPHEALTGRRERLPAIRQTGGLHPYPRRAESPYDAFGVGHCGTAIGAALGVAIAAARRGAPRRVVAIIGEKALTAGMTFEALNHAGSLPANLLIILEDCDTSLSGNPGALAGHFARMLSGHAYTQLREQGKKMLRPMPTVLELARRSEQHLKGMLLPSTLFEELGFNYIGPIDGRDLQALIAALQNLKDRPGRQLLHVATRAKGKAPAATRRRNTGRAAGGTYAQVFGQWLCDMAESDPRIIAIAPGSADESGLTKFAGRFADRFFDVGHSQQHAVTFAAGLAAEGLRPVVAIDSTFLQRAYDQLIHDVALQRLPVVFAVGGAGLTGVDGPTHQGGYDISYLRCIPNTTIMTPADEDECRQLLYTASTLPGPSVVRYPRALGAGVTPNAAMCAIPVGRAQVRLRGRSGIALLVFGTLLDAARQVAEALDGTLVSMRFVRPLDRQLLSDLASNHQALVTIEENALAAGAGSAVGEALASLGLPMPLLQLGIPDRFIEHGARESCLAAARLDAAGLRSSIERWRMLQRRGHVRSAAGGQ
jgi:1-deoxy-D-xylulose-5-phosphate synthase